MKLRGVLFTLEILIEESVRSKMVLVSELSRGSSIKGLAQSIVLRVEDIKKVVYRDSGPSNCLGLTCSDCPSERTHIILKTMRE